MKQVPREIQDGNFTLLFQKTNQGTSIFISILYEVQERNFQEMRSTKYRIQEQIKRLKFPFFSLNKNNFFFAEVCGKRYKYKTIFNVPAQWATAEGGEEQ